jgi:hypothetical protein
MPLISIHERLPGFSSPLVLVEVIATSPSVGTLMRGDGVLRVAVGALFLVRYLCGCLRIFKVDPENRETQKCCP